MSWTESYWKQSLAHNLIQPSSLCNKREQAIHLGSREVKGCGPSGFARFSVAAGLVAGDHP